MLNHKSRICLIHGQLPQAQELLLRAEDLIPNNTAFLSTRAELSSQLGISEMVDRDLNETIKRAPNQIYLKAVLARRLLKEAIFSKSQTFSNFSDKKMSIV